MKHLISEHQLEWFGRVSLFIIFFWFGILKVLTISPADQLVDALRELTIPFLSFDQFFPILGGIESLIGILFLIPRASKIVIVILLAHMATTLLPLAMLPSISWAGFMVPTLVGQYIIKNLALIALALLVTLHHDTKTA